MGARTDPPEDSEKNRGWKNWKRDGGDRSENPEGEKGEGAETESDEQDPDRGDHGSSEHGRVQPHWQRGAHDYERPLRGPNHQRPSGTKDEKRRKGDLEQDQ